VIAIVGGTGPEGAGLATRFAMAGEAVAIGSRSAARAEEAAARIRQAVGGSAGVSGGENSTVAGEADIIILAVPLEGVEPALSELAPILAGKLVVSVVAAVRFVEGRPEPVSLPAGSVAQTVAELLPDSQVASAFHTLSASKMADTGVRLDEDTIICGASLEVRSRVIELAQRIEGLCGVDGGRLANSHYSEQFVGMLAALNRLHKARAGLRIVDLE